MEFLPALRLIWRRRLLLGLGVLAAVAAFVGLGGMSSVSQSTGLAWTSVALDTPQSELAAVAPAGAETLPWRASLLTHLMATESSTQELARRVGVPADQLLVIDAGLTTPLVTTALAKAAGQAASDSVAPYVLTVSDDNDSLPVISIQASAPDLAGATRLAQAAVAVLQAQASPGGTFTSPIATGGNVARLQPFDVDQVSPTRVTPVTATSLPTKALGGSLFVLLAWCAGGGLALRLSRRMRGRGRPVPA